MLWNVDVRFEGFRTPATVQAASLRSAGIRNPQQQRSLSLMIADVLIEVWRHQMPLILEDARPVAPVRIHCFQFGARQ
jgi:hypothetical protein